jgi:tetratricopeptide (TPR) repeat protein
LSVLILTACILADLPCLAAPVGQSAHDRARSLANSAENAYQEGRFFDAVSLFSKAAELTPAESSIYLGRGMANEMLGRPDQAIEDYKRALGADPRNYCAMENLAGVYERGGKKVREAIELYRRALELDPRSVWQENLGVWIKILESRENPESSSAVALWNRGNEHAATGNNMDAESCYTGAIALNPLMYQAFFSRGLLHLKKRDLAAALSDFDAALSIDPHFPGGLVQRGMLYEEMGYTGKALEDFRQASELVPRDPQGHFHLGRILEKNNEFEKALRSYQEALRLNPKPELLNLVLQGIASARVASGNRSLRSTSEPRRKKESR